MTSKTIIAAAYVNNSSFPRILRSVFSQQLSILSPSLLSASSSPSSSSSCIAKKNANPVIYHFGYSPHDLLSQFHSSVKLTIKRSLKKHHRFFMYEEQSRHDGLSSAASTVTVSPTEFATLLHSNRRTSDYHYYWTSPIADVAPQSMMSKEFHWFNQLQSDHPLEVLDPRGPSLWMGTSGSGTQCHYDVADNVIVQLYGKKRIRIYPPSVGVYNLHVFPDAHPKARKSQVDFDSYNNITNGSSIHRNNITFVDDGRNIQQRFPHAASVPNPSMDVVLQPGDALRIPAFWFHHVENGYVPQSYDSDDSTIRTVEASVGEYDGFDDNHQPSVSLNRFALSESMMIARRIFQSASRPLGGKQSQSGLSPNKVELDDGKMEFASSLLRALGIALIRGLNVVNVDEEKQFISTYLMEARYSPLRADTTATHQMEEKSNSNKPCPPPLTSEHQEMVSLCIERILPDFHLLGIGGKEDGVQHECRDDSSSTDDGKGIQLLVALHLLELWAVELVGPKLVAKAWNRAL